MSKPRLLTGDTPTGKLHLGHWVGSLENRVKLQEDYDCYFLLANLHAFTTRVGQPEEIRQSTLDIALDYVAAGIDPQKSTIFIESDVPAIYELASIFSMLIPFPRLMRNPTIKDEIRDKQLGDNYSMGFLLYPLLQVADILACQAAMVPVGEDQIPHLELTREVARRFYQLYCQVDSEAAHEYTQKTGQSEDDYYYEQGQIFPVPQFLLGRVRRLVGTGGPAPHGELYKMSKSLNNAIFLSDDADTVKQKVMGMYTDPNRLRATDPGCVENNPLWIFHETFNADKQWVEESKEKYRAGHIGDVECKKRLVDVLNAVLTPMRERRAEYAKDPAMVLEVLRQGAEKTNCLAQETLAKVREKIRQRF
ncbi:MAG: tryptophan--tRNA ligase [Coxiella sp. RIFCSPHIGHO2_12_FULL_44_14]|nr:MAG: tryptophan--tRNA ligase [Coxiella sp. RIFCSPHIGHO2_12_FULL_44_14]